MKIDEIYKLKRLAGILDREGNVVDSDDGSNIIITGSDKGRVQREKNIKPGTDEWFEEKLNGITEMRKYDHKEVQEAYKFISENGVRYYKDLVA